ncbi:hypothetical protein [Rosenbergiella nectarea]|nr:hypothetical protein [Rosenbergiella nectarea]
MRTLKWFIPAPIPLLPKQTGKKKGYNDFITALPLTITSLG